MTKQLKRYEMYSKKEPAKSYVAHCYDSTYDADDGFLVLYCHLKGIGKRIVCMHKNDFHSKVYSSETEYTMIEVSDSEMTKTAELFKNKPFNLVINDDPDIKVDDRQKFIEMFNDKVQEETDKLSEEDFIYMGGIE